MNKMVLIILMGVHAMGFGQAWVDSVETARKHYQSKQFGKAQKTYERLDQNKKKGISIQNELAQTHYRNQDYAKANRYYEKSLADTKTRASKAKIWHNIGNSKIKIKDFKGAISAFKKALRLDPQNEETRYNLSEALRRKSKKNNPSKNKKPDNKPKDQNDDPSDRSKNIPNKKVDKILDELAKQELKTKRKLGRNKRKSSSNPKQDW